MRAPEGVSWEIIKPLVPKFISYALSFLYVAIYWGNHHHMMHTVKKVTPQIIWANMGLLFTLSLIPFTTAWMGENHFERITVAAYAMLALLCGVTYTILQSQIVKQYDHTTVLTKYARTAKWKVNISTLAYASAIPIALYVNPVISGCLFLLVSIMWLIPDRVLEKVE